MEDTMLDLTNVNTEVLAKVALSIIRDTEGFLPRSEYCLLQEIARPTLAIGMKELAGFYHGFQHPQYEDVAELLHIAFIAGWASRGAVEAAMRGETPVSVGID
jgi:hypothetical protein